MNETTPDNLGGLQADETTLGVRLPTRNNLKKSEEKSTMSEETAQSPKETARSPKETEGGPKDGP